MNSKQRAHLRSLAHHLPPVVHVGKEGVTEAAVRNVSDAFNKRELLKVKVLEAAPQSVREVAEALSAEIEGVQLVQVIGRTAVLYRRHPDKPKVELPG